MIIIKNYFQGIPKELEEAARVDGSSVWEFPENNPASFQAHHRVRIPVLRGRALEFLLQRNALYFR